MMSIAVVTVVTLFLAQLWPQATASLSAHGSNVCSYSVPTTYSYRIKVAYTAYQRYTTCCAHFMWCWKKCTRTRAVRRYRPETRYSVRYNTYYRCCSGWRQASSWSSSCSIPICNSPGCVHGQCVRPNICHCSSGWTSPATGCNLDLNECASSNGGCDQQCHNYPGGYNCVCRRGFTLVGTTRCQDTDECSLSHGLCSCDDAANNPSCTATCSNTIGSYRCACSTGYQIISNSRCVDKNECMSNRGGCTHVCNNVPGSYRCSCHPGYQLDSNQMTCSDINECLTSNGGCEHNCINRNGDHICRCRSGHILDYNGRTCSDIDECSLNHHACQHTCNNYKGGFFCSCRSGFRLNTDNTTCSDIDECSLNHHACQHTCNNYKGGFFCSCRSGFRLNTDNTTCSDVDECSEGTHGCKQICINSIGSYVCKCQLGYRLNADARSCDALPCIRHPPVVNGEGSCFFGKTNDTCRFSCRPGFDFRGSRERRCLPNHTWSGSLPTCSRKHCLQLEAPANGGLQLPCFTYFQATCRIKCNDGYYATGPTERTCRATNNNAMTWSSASTTCKKITVCSPNPCKHGGICEEVSKVQYRCNCNGVGHIGDTCNRGIVGLPTYPLMNFAQEYSFTMTAQPDVNLTVDLTASNKELEIMPRKLEFNSTTKESSFNIRANVSGAHVIYYKLNGVDVETFDAPLNSIVYVRNTATGNNTITDQIIDDKGGLNRGCFDQQVKQRLKNGTAEMIKLHSSAPWEHLPNHLSTNGVIVMEIEGTSMPQSIIGANVSFEQIKNHKFDDFVSQFGDSQTGDKSIPSKDESEKCASQKPSTQYLTDIVDLNSFQKTVAEAVNKRTPGWFRMAAAKTVNSFQPRDFIAKVITGNDLKKLYPDCIQELKGVKDEEWYYAYSTNQNVLLSIAEEDLFLNAGKQVCIFQSVRNNDTLIGFPKSAKESETLKSAMSWSGKTKSIQFSNSSGSPSLRMSGKYSTTLKSELSSIKVTLDGDMHIVTGIQSELLVDGIEATETLAASGDITVRIEDKSTGTEEKTSFFGPGSMQMKRIGNGIPPQNIRIDLNSVRPASSDRIMQGAIRLKKNSTIAITASTVDSGGKISGSQKSINADSIQTEVQSLKKSIEQPLQDLLRLYPSVRNEFSAMLRDFIQASATTDSMVTSIKDSIGPPVLLSLMELKSLIDTLDRRFQVVSTKLRNHGYSPANITSFQNITERFEKFRNKTNSLLQQPLNRTEIKRMILASTFSTNGTMCLDTICFKNCFVTTYYGLSQTQIKQWFNYDSKGSNLSVIVGRLSKETVLAGKLILSKNSTIVRLVNKSGNAIGLFNASFTVYGQTKIVSVKLQESKMEFASKVILPGGSETDLKGTAKLKDIYKAEEIVIKINGELEGNEPIIEALNRYLQTEMERMSKEIGPRIKALKQSVNMTAKQLREAEVHMQNLKVSYEKKLTKVWETERQLNATIARYNHWEKLFIDKLKQHDSKMVNYTDELRQCAPRLCMSKCTPGVVVDICYDATYTHALRQECKLVTRAYVTTEVQEVASQDSYVSYNAESHCQTKCPPLTGFFKKIFGRRRRDVSHQGKSTDIALVRKRRGIISFVVKKVAEKIFKTGTEKLFGYLGGEAGALGAKIGAMLPGPFGIVGAILGGVIGSAFGSCDKICHTNLIPVLNTFTRYEAERVSKTKTYKECECIDVVEKYKTGFHDGYECYRQSNCSETLTDVKCVVRNAHCQVIRAIIVEKIRQERALGPTFDEYKKGSLAVEALELSLRFALRDKKNEYKKLQAAKTSILKLNYSHEISKQSLASVSRVLSLEMKANKVAGQLGYDAFSVKKGQFSYYLSKTGREPTVLALQMGVTKKDGDKFQVTSLFDFGNDNASIADATKELLLKGLKENSRSRRSLENDVRSGITVTIDGMSLNNTREKCRLIDKSIIYILEVVELFQKGLAQHKQAALQIKIAEPAEANFTQGMKSYVGSQSVCSKNESTSNCTSEWLNDLYQNATNSSFSASNMSLSWPTKLAQIRSRIEIFTESQNFSRCAGAYDCVVISIKNVSELLQFDKSRPAATAREQVSKWRSLFVQVLETEQLKENETESYLAALLDSIVKSKARNVFCDPPPVILKDLPKQIVVTRNSVANLSISIASGDHEVFYEWRKDEVLLPAANTHFLLLRDMNKQSSGYYTCIVSNRFGTATSHTSHVVFDQLPRITKHPKDLKTVIKAPNSDILLTCNATGLPTPQISWFFVPFKNNSNPMHLPSNETLLKINSTSSMQSGLYYCNATNRQGFAVSSSAKVHVLESIVATFAVRVSFYVHLPQNVNRSSANHVAVNNGTENGAVSSNMTESLNGTLHSNGTLNSSESHIVNKNDTLGNSSSKHEASRSSKNQSITANEARVPQLPELLSDYQKMTLAKTLAKTMNISETRLRSISFTRESSKKAYLSLDIIAQDLNPLLQNSHPDWMQISEDTVMARKGLLALTIWLQYYYTNVTSHLTIADIKTNVDADTMEIHPLKEECPVGYTLHTNGYICRKCSAGTMYVPLFGCQPCPIGTFQPNQGELQCNACETNHTTRATGSVYYGDCIMKEKPTTAPLSTTKKATTTTTTELLLSTISTTEKEEGSKPPKQSRPPTTGKSTGGKWKTSDVFHSTETSVTTKPLPGTPGPIEKEEDGTNIGIIVGILVSLLIAIIMVAVVGVKCYRKRAAQKGNQFHHYDSDKLWFQSDIYGTRVTSHTKEARADGQGGNGIPMNGCNRHSFVNQCYDSRSDVSHESRA